MSCLPFLALARCAWSRIWQVFAYQVDCFITPRVHCWWMYCLLFVVSFSSCKFTTWDFKSLDSPTWLRGSMGNVRKEILAFFSAFSSLKEWLPQNRSTLLNCSKVHQFLWEISKRKTYFRLISSQRSVQLITLYSISSMMKDKTQRYLVSYRNLSASREWIS